MKLFRRILVPHDFSGHADAALKAAATLAKEHGGRLIVLHVIAPFYGPPALPDGAVAWPGPAELVPDQLKILQDHVAGLIGRHAPKHLCRVEVGDPSHRIVAAASSADSIVMATAGRTGLAHLLIGSVAERVVRLSPIPVLTIRPEKRSPSTTRRPGKRSRAGSTRR